jgi:hypothetical protein
MDEIVDNLSLPAIVLGVTVCLIVFAIGTYAYFSVLSPLETEKSITQYFAVTDPSVDQACTLTYSPASGTVVVTQFNGNEWLAVSPSYVSTSGGTVTIAAGGLQG